MSFHVNLDDIHRMLGHIKIAERHVQSGYGVLTDELGNPLHNLMPYGLRTVSGQYNNLIHIDHGASGGLMPRLLAADFRPAGNDPRSGQGTSYAQTSGSVYDSAPRTISNLVSDQSVDNPAVFVAAFTALGSTDPYGDAARYADARKSADEAAAGLQELLDAIGSGTGPQPDPADVAAARALADSTAATLQALPAELGLEFDVNDRTLFVPNVMPDLGDTAPFNGFLTLFGQFFDHGLDLVSKGGSGTVYVPLQPDDPLYVAGSPTNFMVLTRATNQPGADGIVGTADDVREHRNETTPFIDLNQVYTSHESHQVFLREYVRVEIDGVMRTLATGHMLEGEHGGPPTWADIKQQAREMLGIELTDMDVHRVPLVATDLYGNFQPGANGFAQLVTPDGLLSGDAAVPASAGVAYGAGRAFLNDIAHSAAPGLVDHDRNPGTAAVPTTADADDEAGNAIPLNPYGVATTYDNELLDQHFIVGDGRGNENIGLTAVHHVFHSEHNHRVEQIKEEILAGGDVDFINEWLLVPIEGGAPADAGDLLWNGERLFQAARFSTEMVYQHLVFEEFARLVSPDIDPFVFSNTVDIDPAIVAEFAHVVYRFGHSMLRETVDRLGADGQTAGDIGLIDAFLNPREFVASGADADAAAGAIIRGMSRQVGSEIDEFLTEALRNNLVGLPLDLGALNIARGRDVGVPSLNEARRQFFEQTNDSALRPYDSWYDFALGIKNPASLINFIAAYGTHGTIAGATTLEARRAAAGALVLGGSGAPADRLDFLNATGAWAGGALGGLDDVDFWIGGLAEKKMPFGGQLGSTFNFVFEVQMENLQDGDRFYYLSRTQGMNLLNQLEADSFAELVMRNTDLGDPNATHLPSSLFLTPAFILELEQSRQKVADPNHSDPILAAIRPMVTRLDTDGDGHDDYLRYAGVDHVVIGGNDRANTLIGGEGDDTLWGDGGDDRLEGGLGVDHLFGGDGDDILTDAGTDSGAADVIHGDAGNDVINGGMGLDLIFGGTGQDFIFGGGDGKTITAGEGNDFVRGPGGGSFIAGNEGDDWLEGGDSFDTLAGENSELFFNSPIIGHDVLDGRGNDTDYDGESGDDIMVQGLGIQRNNGMAGFDWAIHKGAAQGADSDLGIPIFVNQEAFILRDRFDLVEGLSGWVHDDRLTGRDVVVGQIGGNGGAAQATPNSPFESYSNALLEEGVARIAGLSELVAHLGRASITVAGQEHRFVVFDEAALGRDAQGNVTSVEDTAADILLGGGGSDILQGKAGNDVIDGDRWLNVRIRVNDAQGHEIGWSDGLSSKVYSTGGALLYGGRTLDSLMFDRTLNPGQLSIVREILDGDAMDTAIDQAVYRGNRAEYEIEHNDDGSVTVRHAAPVAGGFDDGTDRLFNIERLVFADETVSLVAPDIVGTEGPDVLAGDERRNRILGLGGDDVLLGGAGNDWMDGGLGNDYLDGGAGADQMAGGEGDDFLVGGAGDDQMAGDTGADVLRGDAGSDRISGGAGDDYLDGGDGADQMAGGDGNDFLVGGSGDDQMAGDIGADALLGDAGNDRVSGGEGDDYVDGGVGDDQLAGDQGNDYLDGGIGNDQLTGGQGNDFLDGGTGVDQMAGGEGDDTYVVDNAADAITEAAGEGVDWVRSTAASYTLSANVENLELLGAAIGGAGNEQANRIAGNALDNVLVGNGGDDLMLADAGNDQLDGGQGNDYLDGGTGDDELAGGQGSDFLDGGIGADQMAGGEGDDTYLVDNAGDVVTEGADQGLDWVRSTVASYTLSANAENLELMGAAVSGTGNELANRIAGNALDNVLSGNGGDDLLLGDAGNDLMDGGQGNDYLGGGSGNDQLIGGQGNDFLDGGTGADQMAGGEGDDTYLVDDAADVVTEGAGEGIDWVRSSLAGHELAANVENLVLVNSAVRGDGNELANWIGGNELDNVLSGNGGDDALYGQAGNDVIDAGEGNDFVYGGDGDDMLNGGLGDDILFGGAGQDIFVFHESFGRDRVHDFDADIDGGQDRIDISALGITAETFEALVSITASAGGTLVTIGDQTITFAGVDGIGGNAITQSDFMLT